MDSVLYDIAPALRRNKKTGLLPPSGDTLPAEFKAFSSRARRDRGCARNPVIGLQIGGKIMKTGENDMQARGFEVVYGLMESGEAATDLPGLIAVLYPLHDPAVGYVALSPPDFTALISIPTPVFFTGKHLGDEHGFAFCFGGDMSGNPGRIHGNLDGIGKNSRIDTLEDEAHIAAGNEKGIVYIAFAQSSEAAVPSTAEGTGRFLEGGAVFRQNIS